MNKKIQGQNKWRSFLWDVFICSLGAYGGPEAHYGIFMDQLVTKKKYLKEEEFVELMALTQILPGPSSTQTIVAIGHKIGGGLLGLLTMIVWALPVLIVMTAFSFMGDFLAENNLSKEAFRYISPMALAFIFMAAYRLAKKVIKDRLTFILFIASAIITVFFRLPWVFPLLLLIGGGLAIFQSNEKEIWNKVVLHPPWIYLIFFAFFALAALVFAYITKNTWIDIFESFYRYGYLVIGGGQVVVPLMNSELVELNGYLSQDEFLRGFGLVQGLPGPMFSFSAYAGGMATRGSGVFLQILGAALAGIGIFLPGLLLIYFVFPIWEEVKKIRGIKISLLGITAVASGFVLASGIHMSSKITWNLYDVLVLIFSMILLYSKKVPAPILVLLVLLIGYFLPF